MQKIKYGEPISVIVRDNNYHQVVVRYLTSRVELHRIGDLWNERVDTSTIPRSLIEECDGVLDLTAYDNGEPIAMGAVKIELDGTRLELEPLAPPTMSINPPTQN